MSSYATGMTDYTGGGGGGAGGGAYDYNIDTDVGSFASTGLNTAIQADRDIALPMEDFYNNVSYFTTTTSTAIPDIVGSQSPCGTKGPADYPSDMLILTAVCAFVIAILGTCGNVLTIIALPMSRKLRTTATAFVVNLAVVELLFCAIIMPMSGAQYVYLQRTRESLLDDNGCIFFTVVRYTLTQVELQTILAIALTRALAVAVPRMYSFLNKSSVIGSYISFIWLYSFLLKLPTALGILGSYGFNQCTMECDMVSGDKASRFTMIIIEAIVPVIVIILLYLFVFIMVIRRACLRNRKFSKPIQLQPQVKRSSNRVAKVSCRANTTKSPVPPATSSAASTSSNNTNSSNQRKESNSSFRSLKRMVSESSLRARLLQVTRAFTNARTHQSSTVSQRLCTNRRDMRVARTIFIIFLVVLICSVPVALIHMFDRTVKHPVRFLALHILYWVQYCLNVVIYVFMNRQYRDAYIECLARVFPQFQRHQGRKFFWEKASISSKPPQNLPTSTRQRLDSNDAVFDSTASEPEPVVAAAHPPPIGVQGRLSTIPEGNSSSAANDSVFSDPGKKDKYGQLSSPMEDNPYYEDEKCFDSEASDSEDETPEAERKALMDEQEQWVTQNGATGGNLVNTESKV